MIFTYQFKTKLKSLLLCSWRGHAEPKRYTDIYWAIGHFSHQAKLCSRCRTEIKRKPTNWVKYKVITPANKKDWR